MDNVCSMCGFGIHMEQRPHRFDRLRQRSPKEWEFLMYHLCKDEAGNDFGWGRVLDYIGVGWEDVPGACNGECGGCKACSRQEILEGFEK